jgi:Domain of unknown function (DUF6316)
MNPTALRHRDMGEKFPFRSNSRFLNEQGLWYFAAREGIKGPYKTRQEAEIEAMMFIRSVICSDCFGVEFEHRVAC